MQNERHLRELATAVKLAKRIGKELTEGKRQIKLGKGLIALAKVDLSGEVTAALRNHPHVRQIRFWPSHHYVTLNPKQTVYFPQYSKALVRQGYLVELEAEDKKGRTVWYTISRLHPVTKEKYKAGSITTNQKTSNEVVTEVNLLTTHLKPIARALISSK